MNIPDALAELGHFLGIGTLALNDDGAARIQFDESIAVDFFTDLDDPNVLHLMGAVCPAGPDLSPEFLRELMQAHFLGLGTGGAIFSLDPLETEVQFGRRLDMSRLQFTDFTNAVESFVNYLEAWQRKVASGELQPASSAA